MTETVIFHQDGAIARIILNNPLKSNALGSKELFAIRRYLADIEKDSFVRVLILSATKNATFCAGASLDELKSENITSNDFQGMSDMLAKIKIPTICAINGSLFGGGAELALSCDFRFATKGIKMRVPASALGLCYPTAGIHRYVERLGQTATKRILLAAETFSDKQLLEIGFIDRILEVDEFEIFVTQYARNISKLAPLSLRAMKQIINDKSRGVSDDLHAEELEAQCLESYDLEEGLTAREEKRDPIFRGI